MQMIMPESMVIVLLTAANFDGVKWTLRPDYEVRKEDVLSRVSNIGIIKSRLKYLFPFRYFRETIK